MKVVLVGNRHGNAVINWHGVLAVSGIVAAISLAGASVFMLATSWFSPPTAILAVALSVGTIVGFGIQRSLQLPIDQLTPLK